MTRASSCATSAPRPSLLLIGIPVLLWTLIPIYHMFLFAISPKDAAFSGQLWPDASDAAQLRASCSARSTTFSDHFWLQMWNSLVDRAARSASLTLFDRHGRRLRDQPAAGAGRPHW